MWIFININKFAQPRSLDYAEVLLIGAVDTGIMSQNVLLAAESLGLGGVYIGSLRNEMEAVGKLLNLPEHCLPMVGMCLGYPDQEPPSKPRLPKETLFFENTYNRWIPPNWTNITKPWRNITVSVAISTWIGRVM